jgi:hypothetical protein
MGVVLVAACMSDAPEPRAESDTELLTSPADTSQQARLLGFATRQQAFLRAITESSAELSEYISAGFLLRDASKPSSPVRRDLLGQPVFLPNPFQSLNVRIDPEYAVIESMELRAPRPDQVLVVARHASTLTSITGWLRRDDKWKAISFSINVSDGAVNRTLALPHFAGS